MSELHRPIFVVGCPRSGTTLVQCMLSANSAAFSLPETHFFSYVLTAIGATPATPLRTQDLADARAALEEEAALHLPDAFWARMDGPGRLARDLFVAIVEHFRPHDGQGLRAIEKTPLHVMHLDTIGSCFPDARFVNVVRDPIDVASSLLRVPWEQSRSVTGLAQRWTESVQSAEAYAARHPARLWTVVYETLVRDPERVVRELCTFLDLRYEPVMLEEFGREAARNVGRSETWKQGVHTGVLLDRQGAWREHMTAGQAWLVARTTASKRRAYGYAAPTRPSLSVGTVAALGEISVRFREARPSVGVVGAARHAGSLLRKLANV